MERGYYNIKTLLIACKWEKQYGILLGLTITFLNDAKYAKVVVMCKTLKSLIIPDFSDKYMLTYNEYLV
jgi:hypothetical protein